jgi:hypothetical protein
MSNNYPKTVNEVLDSSMRFNAAALAAVKGFARAKPWRGTLAERRQKIVRLYAELSAAYSIDPPRIVFADDGIEDSTFSRYSCVERTIILSGTPSVVTALHEYAHHRGMNERDACRWSINLFRRVWPNAFARCRHDGHVLRSPLAQSHNE